MSSYVTDTDHGITAEFTTMHGPADDARVDQWELAASRRALANIRTLMFRQPMLDLLADQIAEAERLHRKYLAASAGEWASTEVTLRASGLTMAEFLPGIRAVISGTAGTEEESRATAIAMSFPLHPEHYGVPPYAGVVETMGGIPTLTRVSPDPEPPAFVAEHIDPSYTVSSAGRGELPDGTEHSHVLQQFRDTEDGIEASLRIWYPAACPPEYLAEHAEHYAVESRNLLRVVAAGLGK